MSNERIRELAARLKRAHEDAECVQAESLDWLPGSFEEAYAVQRQVVAMHEDGGATRVGLKAGVTNRKTLRSLGGHEPLGGVLFNSMAVPENGEIDGSTLVGPKVEAEIAFVLREELKGPACYAAQVLRATEFIVPVIEIVDSRLLTEGGPQLHAIAADNVAASYFITGAPFAAPESLNLRTLGVVVDVDGETIGLGAGAAVWNDPAASVAALANSLWKRGETIPAGSLVLAGSLIPPTPVPIGCSIYARFQHLGTVHATISKS